MLSKRGIVGGNLITQEADLESLNLDLASLDGNRRKDCSRARLQ